MPDNILMIAQLRGRGKPPDAEILICSQCGCEGLCRPSARRLAWRDATLRGTAVIVLCEVCAQQPVRTAMMRGDVELIANPKDALCGINWIRARKREVEDSN